MILDLTYIQKTALQNSKSHSGMIKPPPPKEVDFQDELNFVPVIQGESLF